MAMNPRLLRPRATGFNPRSIASLSLWLDASDSSTLFDATSGGSAVAADGAVASWTDKSGAGLNAIQSVLNNRPLRKTNIQNGRDVLRFDGLNDRLQISSMTLPTYITAFVVSATTRTFPNLKLYFEHGAGIGSNAGFFFNGTYGGAWAVNRNSGLHDGPSIDASDWSGTSWVLAAVTYDGTGTIYKNNAFVSSATYSGTARSNSDVTAALNIGSRNQTSLFLTGDIGEILIYNRVLTAAERDTVSNGLNKKWKIY